MADEKLFLLLDIDGVLLESFGYQEAYLDTANDFLKQMGQPDLRVNRVVWESFEANGIRAEWDMLPLTLASVVNWYCEQTGEQTNLSVFPPDCGAVRLSDQDAFEKMLLERSKEYCSLLDPAMTSIDSVYHAYKRNNGAGLEHLWSLPVRDRFFIDTLNPWKCPFFAQLMNRLLGSKEFTAFYDMPAVVDCESYLVEKDQLLISDHYRKLLPEISGKKAYPVVMTYRPTRLPVVDGNKTDLYYVNTPEGECAMRLLDWDDGRIRMIGCGDICYAEEKFGHRREHYVKPHPFHGLVSLFYALCGDKLKAIEIARLLCDFEPDQISNPASEYLSFDQKIRIAVFEDSVTGISSAANAAKVLRKWGYNADPVLCGIRTTAAKNNRLLYAGAVLYPNVNAALKSVLGQ